MMWRIPSRHTHSNKCTSYVTERVGRSAPRPTHKNTHHAPQRSNNTHPATSLAPETETVAFDQIEPLSFAARLDAGPRPIG